MKKNWTFAVISLIAAAAAIIFAFLAGKQFQDPGEDPGEDPDENPDKKDTDGKE